MGRPCAVRGAAVAGRDPLAAPAITPAPALDMAALALSFYSGSVAGEIGEILGSGRTRPLLDLLTGLVLDGCLSDEHAPP